MSPNFALTRQATSCNNSLVKNAFAKVVPSDQSATSDQSNLQPAAFVFQLTLTLPVTYGNSR